LSTSEDSLRKNNKLKRQRKEGVFNYESCLGGTRNMRKIIYSPGIDKTHYSLLWSLLRCFNDESLNEDIEAMIKSKPTITIWRIIIYVLVGVWLASCAWIGREVWLDVWRFWTDSVIPTSVGKPNPFHTGFILAISLLGVVLAGIGLIIGVKRRELLLPLILASAVLDIYMRSDAHDGPTIFLPVMWILIVIGIFAWRKRVNGRDPGSSGKAIGFNIEGDNE